jgi:hypothetical protein
VLEREFQGAGDPGVDTLFDFGPSSTTAGPTSDSTSVRDGDRGAVMVRSHRAETAVGADPEDVVTTSTATALAEATSPARVAAPPRRRLNPKAGFPYLIGAVILALEVLFIV